MTSASRPWMAAQVFVATTATPPSGLNFEPSGAPGICTTACTPGIALAAASSTDLTVPSTTAGRATAA
jgi:hypothetical protein